MKMVDIQFLTNRYSAVLKENRKASDVLISSPIAISQVDSEDEDDLHLMFVLFVFVWRVRRVTIVEALQRGKNRGKNRMVV